MKISETMRPDVGLAVSFGGTKIAAALVDLTRYEIIRQSDRVEWRDFASDTGGIIALCGDIAGSLLDSADLSPRQVRRVGIAWPGPGKYSLGIVTASFVFGFERPRSIFELLGCHFRGRFGADWRPDIWTVQLDASARARGELVCQEGVLKHQSSGTLLNIATGIAGAFTHKGVVLREIDDLGETYGQWGRFLVWRRKVENWEWRPTLDGSVPVFNPETEVRFTALCGGPALARRFATEYSKSKSSSEGSSMARLCNLLLSEPRRDVSIERQLLKNITLSAGAGDDLALEFVANTGEFIGSAIQCMSTAVGAERMGSRIVLTGGVGELLGRALVPDGGDDVLLSAAHRALGRADTEWMRSRIGLSAELVGAVAAEVANDGK